MRVGVRVRVYVFVESSEQAYCSVLCRTAAGNETDPTFCVISGFRRSVYEIFSLRGWHTT